MTPRFLLALAACLLFPGRAGAAPCEPWILVVLPPESELHEDLKSALEAEERDESDSLFVYSTVTDPPALITRQPGFAQSYERLAGDFFASGLTRVLLSRDRIGAFSGSGKLLRQQELQALAAPDRKYRAISEAAARRAPDGRIWFSFDDWTGKEPREQPDSAPRLYALTEEWAKGGSQVTPVAWPWAPSVGRWVRFARGGKPGSNRLYAGWGEQAGKPGRHAPRVGMAVFDGPTPSFRLLPPFAPAGRSDATLVDLQETDTGVAALWSDGGFHASLWEGSTSSWRTLPPLELGTDKASLAVTSNGTETLVASVRTLRKKGAKYSRKDPYVLELHAWERGSSQWRLLHPEQEAGLKIPAARYRDGATLWLDGDKLILSFMSETEHEGYSDVDVFFARAHGTTHPAKLAKLTTRSRDVFILERSGTDWRARTPSGLVRKRAIPTGHSVLACH
jgi:hypothetical protein